MSDPDADILAAVKWLWSHRDKNLYWRPSVLTDKNPDPSAPKLTPVQAESVFRLLREKGLTMSVLDGLSLPAESLHVAKVAQWNAFIEELKQRHSLTETTSQIPTAQEPGDQGDNDEKKHPHWLIVIGITVTEAIGVCLWELSDGLHNLWLTLSHWMSLECFLLGVCFAIYEYTKRLKWTLALCAVSIAITAAVAFNVWPPRPPNLALPHFHLAFVTSDPSGIAVTLHMTNKCFVSTIGMPSFGSKVGILNIPVSEEHRLAHTNFSEFLTFVIVNDSEIDGGISELLFDWGSDSIRIPVTDGWSGRVPGEWRTDSLSFTPPSSNFIVIHRDGIPLPTMKFDRINLDLYRMHSGAASVEIKQPNAPGAMYAFIIRFLPDSNMRAYITETDNPIGSKIGAMRITFPPRPSN